MKINARSQHLQKKIIIKTTFGPKKPLNFQSTNYLIIIYMNGYGFTRTDSHSRKQTKNDRKKQKRVPLPDHVDTRMHILLLKCAFKVIYSKTTLML